MSENLVDTFGSFVTNLKVFAWLLQDSFKISLAKIEQVKHQKLQQIGEILNFKTEEHIEILKTKLQNLF